MQGRESSQRTLNRTESVIPTSIDDGHLATPRQPLSIPHQAWMQDATERFEIRMLDEQNKFPCIFGVDAVRKSTLRYTYVPTNDAVRTLGVALQAFAGQAPALGRRTSLVAFFEDDRVVRDVEQWKEHFWSLLQELHAIDPSGWPADISHDPDSPEWEFSFAGMPFFVVANTPSHELRASRYLEYFAITFQPRFVFDDLAAGNRTADNAKAVIRGRLKVYDQLDPSPDLGTFGVPGNREWTQYFLDDHAAPATPDHARYPFVQATATSDPTSTEGTLITMPSFADHTVAAPVGDLAELLPQQGSMEIQNDKPGKTHDWHFHSVDEELFVLDGQVVLFWSENGVRKERTCTTGEKILLPAGTVHGSTASESGATYIIRPDNGVAATTTFLTPEQDPHTTACSNSAATSS